jgi:hypothetical protein
MQENRRDFPEQRIAKLSNSLVFKELPHLERCGFVKNRGFLNASKIHPGFSQSVKFLDIIKTPITSSSPCE